MCLAPVHAIQWSTLIQRTLVQAVKEAQAAPTDADPAAWKQSFVRAMNHLANCSARQAASEQDCSHKDIADMRSEAVSVAASRISEGTACSKQRAEAAARRRSELAAQAAEPDWDASTCVGDDDKVEPRRQRAFRAAVGELLAENPEMAHVHSAQSLQRLIAQRAAALQCCATV